MAGRGSVDAQLPLGFVLRPEDGGDDVVRGESTAVKILFPASSPHSQGSSSYVVLRVYEH